MQWPLATKEVHASQQSGQSQHMITMHVGDANEINLLKGNLVLAQVGLQAFTAIQ